MSVCERECACLGMMSVSGRDKDVDWVVAMSMKRRRRRGRRCVVGPRPLYVENNLRGQWAECAAGGRGVADVFGVGRHSVTSKTKNAEGGETVTSDGNHYKRQEELKGLGYAWR